MAKYRRAPASARPIGSIKVASESGISEVRARLGFEPLRQLHDEVVEPLAVPATRGAWYCRWRLVSLDESTPHVADPAANAETFGRPGSSSSSSSSCSTSAFAQIRFVALVENGTQVLFGSRMADYNTGGNALAEAVPPSLQPGML